MTNQGWEVAMKKVLSKILLKWLKMPSVPFVYTKEEPKSFVILLGSTILES